MNSEDFAPHYYKIAHDNMKSLSSQYFVNKEQFSKRETTGYVA